MKQFLPSKGRKVTQVDSNVLICRTELFQNSFLTFTISEWNKLDPDDRNIETYSLLRKSHLTFESVHLTLPPHIFSFRVKSGLCYITGQWGQVQNKIKEI